MESHSEQEKHQHVNVKVRTPTGSWGEFKFEPLEFVSRAVDESVEHFVKKQELGPGCYSLAMVSDGTDLPMSDTSRLKECGVVNGTVLHLINDAPQVDG
jgi:hypothetical protein